MIKSTTEIRQAFLDFFQSKGHQVVSSSSLIPANDPTLLFTNAGMNQFKDVFLGQDKRNYARAVTAQRCVRAGGKHNDLENVGYTARHHTFFEMLGNFSFGDYFKRDAIKYAWELLTSPAWFNLPEQRLWVTVYKTDDEAWNIWKTEIGIPAERIIRIGDNRGGAYASDNFWQMGDTGPCGPCTEIFYDHGEHVWGGPPGSPDEDGDRYIEIWNIVFMQFNRLSNGTMLPLPKPSVDTGMGLERISAILQHVNSNYQIDLFQKLIKATAKAVGIADMQNKSLYVIADHIRSCAFLVADGVTPSNENRGYVLRRIIRRAVRHGNKLGARSPFFWKLVAPLIEIMGYAATDLKGHQSQVEQILKSEEEQFAKTLDRGLALLDEELEKLKGDMLPGETVFRLYDTFGFPADLTADVCRERHLKIDEEGFDRAMEQQRLRAREASGFVTDYNSVIRTDQTTKFNGYDQLNGSTTVSAIFIDGVEVKVLEAGQKGTVILEQTPFYGESGGQVGDSGELRAKEAHFIVSDTQKYGRALGHIGKLSRGSLKVGDSVEAWVDAVRRANIRLNHSATHLLHAALRCILGEHVIQKGSLVNDSYLRFDFSHSGAMKSQEISAVEEMVNKHIRRNYEVKTNIMALQEAKEKGAMALFGEKYDDDVRVLTMGDFSIELCGGTHASRTGDIGLFRIISESGISAGVRRIEAMTGECAIKQVQAQDKLLSDIAQQLKANSSNLTEKVKAMIERAGALEKECLQYKEQQIAQQSASLNREAIEIDGIKLLVRQLNHIEPKMMRTMVDDLKNQLQSAVIVLATVFEGKISLIAGVTKDLTERMHAGELVTELARRLDGKGGGRPDMAQAGGSDVKSLPDALASVEPWVKAKL